MCLCKIVQLSQKRCPYALFNIVEFGEIFIQSAARVGHHLADVQVCNSVTSFVDCLRHLDVPQK